MCGYAAGSETDHAWKAAREAINDELKGQSDGDLYNFVIYENPSDCPGKFVVRQFTIANGLLAANDAPLIVCNSLDEARKAIPKGLICFQRDTTDDPVIVETWM